MADPDIVAPAHRCPKCGAHAAWKPLAVTRGDGYTMTTRQCASASCRKCWTEDVRDAPVRKAKEERS